MVLKPLTYAAAGVDIDAADRATEGIRGLARRTFDEHVLAGIGSFGAAYSLAGKRLAEPVLVSSADGVGTKLKVAFAAREHGTVGQCLVNHCVNDIAVQGAEPLFFLDYFSAGRLDPGVVESVVGGISRACSENGVALIGGETAEMPDMYRDGEYDLAGFIVGAAEHQDLLLGSRVREGSRLDRSRLQRTPHERLLPGAQGSARGWRVSSGRAATGTGSDRGCGASQSPQELSQASSRIAGGRPVAGGRPRHGWRDSRQHPPDAARGSAGPDPERSMVRSGGLRADPGAREASRTKRCSAHSTWGSE